MIDERHTSNSDLLADRALASSAMFGARRVLALVLATGVALVGVAAGTGATGSARTTGLPSYPRCALTLTKQFSGPRPGYGVYVVRGISCSGATRIGTAVLEGKPGVRYLNGSEATYDGWDCGLDQGALACGHPIGSRKLTGEFVLYSCFTPGCPVAESCYPSPDHPTSARCTA
jgi:hypothetical protein